MTTARLRTLLAGVLVTLAIAGTTSRAAGPLTLALTNRYYIEPATMFITVAVEPDQRNRVLRVEADGDSCFRASDLSLDGANAPRFHSVAFKNLPAGDYTIRAVLMSSETEIAAAETPNVVIIGK